MWRLFQCNCHVVCYWIELEACCSFCKDVTLSELSVPLIQSQARLSTVLLWTLSYKYIDMLIQGRGNRSGMPATAGLILPLLCHGTARVRPWSPASLISLTWESQSNVTPTKQVYRNNGLASLKGTFLEGGNRVPGIVQWPSVIQQNKVSEYVVSTYPRWWIWMVLNYVVYGVLLVSKILI